MGKVIEFMKANEIGDIKANPSERRRLANVCISGVTGGYIPMPESLKPTIIEAIRAYGNGNAVVIMDNYSKVMLHGCEEFEDSIPNEAESLGTVILHASQDAWNAANNEAPKMLEACRQAIYLGERP